MDMYNYCASALDSKLNSSILIESESLENKIISLPENRVLYHCFYDVEYRDSLVGYDGFVFPVFDTVHFDFDSKTNDGIDAFDQTKNLCSVLTDEGVDYQVYFSGNKGFHVAVNVSAVGIYNDMSGDAVKFRVRSLFNSLNEKLPCVDIKIHDFTRKFRAFRSLNEKSGLYKVRITDIGFNIFTELDLDRIRNIAKYQQDLEYAHPKPGPVSKYLTADLSTINEYRPSVRKNFESRVKEIPAGSMIDDSAMKFSSFAGKKCIKSMLGVANVNFNRHDIGNRIVNDLRLTGVSRSEAFSIMSKWADGVFGADEIERKRETERILLDTYDKKAYQYGCFDEIKKSYCSAKCSIYNSVNPKLRAEPFDCTKSQMALNNSRRVSLSGDESELADFSEGELADYILGQTPDLCKSNDQFFQWKGTHWHRIDHGVFYDTITKVAIKTYENKMPIARVRALVEHVISKISIAPPDNSFFSASGNKFNFMDCTVHVSFSDGKIVLDKRPHNKSDYLSYCAPFGFERRGDEKRGTEFGKYLDNRRADIGEDGVRVIKQMLGAALVPFVPRIFFVCGDSNSGKSTLAKLITSLLGQSNVSSVLPALRRGSTDRFLWEPAIGRIANIVLEVPRDAELDVNTLKMVRDKSLVNIDRKGRNHVNATLPFLHIYCCNTMPLSNEGNTGALDNRVSILSFKRLETLSGAKFLDYADTIWADDPGGVLDAARDGLADLISTGFEYHQTLDAKKATKDWQNMSDSVALFFEDLVSGEEPPIAVASGDWDSGCILGKSIYERYMSWCLASGRKARGKHGFYKDLSTRFGVPRKNDARGGERFFLNAVFDNVAITREVNKLAAR
jgi:hypothetical protein